MYLQTVVLSVGLLCVSLEPVDLTKLEEAKKYLEYLDVKVCEGKFEQCSAEFNYNTNSTKENLKKMTEEGSRPETFDAEIIQFDWESFNDSYLLRQAKFYNLLKKPDNVTLNKELQGLTNQMLDYDLIDDEFCEYKNQSVCGDNATYDIWDRFLTSNDSDEVAYYWKQMYSVRGKLIRPVFEKYVEVANKVAEHRGYANHADEWQDTFEVPPIADFDRVVKEIYFKLKYLYLQYFSYIRKRLRTVYGEKAVSKTKPISYHLLLGFTRTESSREEIIPYPNKPSNDVTNELQAQNYTVQKMVEVIEDFYTSMGLQPLPDSFYTKSMFVRPSDSSPVHCNGMEYNFANKKDYRISCCARVNSYWLNVLIHEMFHAHSFLGVKDQPCCFREPPGYGFAEAEGGLMILPFTSRKHLGRLGLTDYSCTVDKEVEINTLFNLARSKLSGVGYMLSMGLWRWDIFRNIITKENYNAAFWEYRELYQGVVPPEQRSEEYLDASEKILVLEDKPHISYLFANVISFQLFEALCIKAGEFDPQNPEANPLHNCDLYGSKTAGALINNMFKIGYSQNWTMSLQAVTGTTEIDVGPMLRFFEPLCKWFEEENNRTGEYIGWK